MRAAVRPLYAGSSRNVTTHNDNPTKVRTYDFIRSVSFRGHPQYLAACAKMTPWQRACRMPSIRMGALVGTPIWVASKDSMMWGRGWAAGSCEGALMRHFQFELVSTPDTTSQIRNRRWVLRQTGLLSQTAVSSDIAELLPAPFPSPEGLHGSFSSHMLYRDTGRIKNVAACFATLSKPCLCATMRRLESRYRRINFHPGVSGCL